MVGKFLRHVRHVQMQGLSFFFHICDKTCEINIFDMQNCYQQMHEQTFLSFLSQYADFMNHLSYFRLHFMSHEFNSSFSFIRGRIYLLSRHIVLLQVFDNCPLMLHTRKTNVRYKNVPHQDNPEKMNNAAISELNLFPLGQRNMTHKHPSHHICNMQGFGLTVVINNVEVYSYMSENWGVLVNHTKLTLTDILGYPYFQT